MPCPRISPRSYWGDVGAKAKLPLPPCTISISPGGINILREMHERIGRKFYGQITDRRIRVSNYGIDKEFRDWLFANYGAEVIKHDSETMIRFFDQQMMLMFMLKYGS